MRFLFVMDPIAGIRIDRDSTFALRLEAQERVHEVLYALPTDLRLEHGVPFARARRCTLRPIQGEHFTLGPPQDVGLRDLDAVFMRKDPPFNMEYIFSTYLLEAAQPHTLVVNRAENLRNHNEKLYALQFPEFCPESLVTASAADIRAFAARLGTSIVVKPLDGNGGEGVFILHHGDPNWNVIVEASTRHGSRPILAQRYLPEARLGDKRVLFVDGEVAGAILRVPGGDDPRGNIHVGAVVHPTELTPREQRLAAALGPRLRADGHIFVGIDVIGEHLTEVNVTSPTGIHEANHFYGTRVQAQVIEAVERRAALNRARGPSSPA